MSPVSNWNSDLYSILINNSSELATLIRVHEKKKKEKSKWLTNENTWEWKEKPKIWKLLVEHDSPNGLLEISEQDQGRLVHLVRQIKVTNQNTGFD